MVLLSTDNRPAPPFVRVYSSRTRAWGNQILLEGPHPRQVLPFDTATPATLLGNVLHWSTSDGWILQFDLDSQRLTAIEGPPITNYIPCFNKHITRADGGALGLAMLSYPHLQVWQRNVNSHGVAIWVLRNTIQMNNVFGLPPQIEEQVVAQIKGYLEDADLIFIKVDNTLYMVELKSMQSKRLHELPRGSTTTCYPFTSFYSPGSGAGSSCS